MFHLKRVKPLRKGGSSSVEWKERLRLPDARPLSLNGRRLVAGARFRDETAGRCLCLAPPYARAATAWVCRQTLRQASPRTQRLGRATRHGCPASMRRIRPQLTPEERAGARSEATDVLLAELKTAEAVFVAHDSGKAGHRSYWARRWTSHLPDGHGSRVWRHVAPRRPRDIHIHLQPVLSIRRMIADVPPYDFTAAESPMTALLIVTSDLQRWAGEAVTMLDAAGVYLPADLVLLRDGRTVSQFRWLWLVDEVLKPRPACLF